MTYGISRTVSLPFAQTVERVTEELKKEGFGVLTTIDVRETLRKKLGVEFGNYVILGACNPPFAHQALRADENMGLLLPCNVIVQERGTGAYVAAFDPQAVKEIVELESIGPIAEELQARLRRVIAAV